MTFEIVENEYESFDPNDPKTIKKAYIIRENKLNEKSDRKELC
jgi:hypothetical protein